MGRKMRRARSDLGDLSDLGVEGNIHSFLHSFAYET